MKKVIKLPVIPSKSDVTNGFGQVDYFDTYQIKKQTDKSAEEIAKELMTLPRWVVVLFKIRNLIVRIFGLKTDRETSPAETFFPMIENREEEVVMGAEDKHLYFRASIMKDQSEDTISLTTLVHFNNVWGKVYFFPVKPFHKIIMRALLKRYLAK